MAVNGLSAQEQTKEVDTKTTQNKETTDTKQANANKNADAKSDPDPQSGVANKKQSDGVLSDLEMTDICGKKVKLDKYNGKVVLIVNVASKCGFTGQYKPLQDLHKKFHQHGFAVVAFPCNQFGKQEPAKDQEISAFCKKKFGIEFDLYSKISVKGDRQAELFKRLTKHDLAPAGKGDIYWNFEKFLVGKDGKPLARFRSNVAPDDDRIISKLKEALGIKDADAENSKESQANAKVEAKVEADAKESVKEPTGDKKPVGDANQTNQADQANPGEGKDEDKKS